MDMDFKPQTQTGGTPAQATGGGTPIPVSTTPSPAMAPATTAPSASVDGVSSAGATPSLVTSAPMTDVKPEPSPTIAAAAAEMNKDDTKSDLDLSPTEEEKKPDTTSLANPTTPATKKPKKRTGLFLFSLLLTAGAFGAAGWFGHAYLNKQKPTPETTTVTQTTQKQEIAPAATATSIITELSKNGTPATYIEGLAPASKPTTGKFFVQPVSSPSASVSFAVTDASKEVQHQKTKAWFTDKGFTATLSTPNDTSKTPATSFTSKDGAVLCDMNVGPAGTNASDQRLFVYCANEADYTALATKLSPLYDQYLVKFPTSNKDGNLLMSGYKETSSKTAGYLLAEVGVGQVGGTGGAKGLFYQSPDKAWHFVVAHQSTTASVPCTTYNTPELKKAYLDQACTNAGVASTVKL